MVVMTAVPYRWPSSKRLLTEEDVCWVLAPSPVQGALDRVEHETPLRYALAVAITTNKKEQSTKEPRWLAIIAMLASGLLYAALPSSLSVGPDWLLLAVLAALMVSTVISHR